MCRTGAHAPTADIELPFCGRVSVAAPVELSLRCTLSSSLVPGCGGRYLVASGDGAGALYVALVGTKAARDVLADANLLQAAVWQEPGASTTPQGTGTAPQAALARTSGATGPGTGRAQGRSPARSPGPAAARVNPTGSGEPDAERDTGAGPSAGRPAAAAVGAFGGRQTELGDESADPGPGNEAPAPPAPAAHRGFLARARGVPAELLYAHARSQGRRIVFCGARAPSQL